jgi:hypothetical protein
MVATVGALPPVPASALRAQRVRSAELSDERRLEPRQVFEEWLVILGFSRYDQAIPLAINNDAAGAQNRQQNIRAPTHSRTVVTARSALSLCRGGLSVTASHSGGFKCNSSYSGSVFCDVVTD